MAHNQVNEIDELLKDLKKTPGFKAYLILNSDGIVIRWDQKQVDQQLEDGGGGETTAAKTLIAATTATTKVINKS